MAPLLPHRAPWLPSSAPPHGSSPAARCSLIPAMAPLLPHSPSLLSPQAHDADRFSLADVLYRRPTSTTASPVPCVEAAAARDPLVTCSGSSSSTAAGYPSGPTNPAGRGSGGEWDPTAGMGAGRGDGEKGRVRVWGCQTRPRTRRVPSVVWRLLYHDKVWAKELELTMETLCGFKGFGDLPKDLKPMYPLLSTKDTDVVYLLLGKYRGFFPYDICYHLTIDMRKKMVTSVPLEGWFPEYISCGFSCKPLVGPCNDKGVPISMEKKKKKKHRYNGRNVAEVPIPMKKPRLETRICY